MKELLIRFRLGMNTFWKRMHTAFLAVATFAIALIEILPYFLRDDLIPEEYKIEARMLYSFCVGIAAAARFTVRNTEELQKVKSKDEFQEKLQP